MRATAAGQPVHRRGRILEPLLDTKLLGTLTTLALLEKALAAGCRFAATTQDAAFWRRDTELVRTM